MRFVGIDVAAERHVVAVVDETDRGLIKATPFSEDAEGYAKLLGLLGAPTDALVAMEATVITGRICSPRWSRPASPSRC